MKCRLDRRAGGQIASREVQVTTRSRDGSLRGPRRSDRGGRRPAVRLHERAHGVWFRGAIATGAGQSCRRQGIDVIFAEVRRSDLPAATRQTAKYGNYAKHRRPLAGTVTG